MQRPARPIARQGAQHQQPRVLFAHDSIVPRQDVVRDVESYF